MIHSWWVPSLGGKVDAVPGYTTYTWFKAPHAGAIYTGHCAQLCGRQHAAMLARVKVVSPADYQQWISRQSNLDRCSQRAGDAAAPGFDRQRKPLEEPQPTWPPPTTPSPRFRR